MLWLGIALLLSGVWMWSRTIWRFFQMPGYGGFDMSAASAFDLGWAQGALLLGAGAGLATHSWLLAVLVAVPAFLLTMCVKPVLGRIHQQRQESTMLAARYFESPEEAVRIASDLLLQQDFRTLATYYDLSGSDLDPADLESGRFFLRTGRPEVCPPGESWRYRHPFPPGWSFEGTRPTAREGVVEVTVGVRIDQGVDSPVQQGRALFLLKRSSQGWQLLPETVDGSAGPEMPVQA